MSPSEHTFACTLLSTRTHLWLYRCHQRHFGGDFLVLDRSAAPDTAVRCWVLELKRAARLRVGRLGVQLARCHRIIEQVAESLGLETRAPVPVIGSQRDVLRVLG